MTATIWESSLVRIERTETGGYKLVHYEKLLQPETEKIGAVIAADIAQQDAEEETVQ